MSQDEFSIPVAVASVMVGFSRPWCLGGDWAIDLWLERVTRQHASPVICVLREHQMELRDYLPKSVFRIPMSATKSVVWKDRQMLMFPVDELLAQNPGGDLVTILLQESDGIDWICPAHTQITLNLSKWITRGINRLPVLAPEIALLLGSQKKGPESDLDLRVALKKLDETQKNWLRGAVLQCNPNHPWGQQF